jgi:hypothetical protein
MLDSPATEDGQCAIACWPERSFGANLYFYRIPLQKQAQWLTRENGSVEEPMICTLQSQLRLYYNSVP